MLTWRVVYIGQASDPVCDQVLEEAEMDNIQPGQMKFVFEVRDSKFQIFNDNLNSKFRDNPLMLQDFQSQRSLEWQVSCWHALTTTKSSSELGITSTTTMKSRNWMRIHPWSQTSEDLPDTFWLRSQELPSSKSNGKMSQCYSPMKITKMLPTWCNSNNLKDYPPDLNSRTETTWWAQLIFKLLKTSLHND